MTQNDSNIEVPRISGEDAHTPREWLQRLAASTPLHLVQAWRDEPEPAFRPATCRLGRDAEQLLILADLEDADIVTIDPHHNERAFQNADAVEFFIKPEGQDAYFEFHVTPNNARLHLRFDFLDPADPETRQERLLEPDCCHSRTWPDPAAGRWLALLILPLATLAEDPTSLTTCRFSCSRYDHSSDGSPPVLSSTSPHQEVDFHRQHEWRTIRL